MSFQFAIYYLFDKTLKVESTSLILGSYQFAQVASQPDLNDDANWIEIKWPTRKEPKRTVAAKVLLFGGKYGQYLLLSQLFQLASSSHCLILSLLGRMSWLNLFFLTLLVISESYKELVSKKNLFLLGKDIWADVVKPKTAVQVSARDLP